jgi:hypothetical protein
MYRYDLIQLEERLGALLVWEKWEKWGEDKQQQILQCWISSNTINLGELLGIFIKNRGLL